MTHFDRISIFLIRECTVSTLQHNNEYEHNNEYVRTYNVLKVSHGFNPAGGEGATHSGGSGSGSGSGRYQETAQNGTYVCTTLFTCIYNVSVSVIRNLHLKKTVEKVELYTVRVETIFHRHWRSVHFLCLESRCFREKFTMNLVVFSLEQKERRILSNLL